MSWKEKIGAVAAGAVAGTAAAGPIGTVGGGIAGGMGISLWNGGKHKKVVVHKEGIEFCSICKKVSWTDVKGKGSALGTDDTFGTIKLRGGIEVVYPLKFLKWDDDAFADLELKHDKGWFGSCKNQTLSELDCENLDAINSEKIAAALSDVLWAHEFFDSINWNGCSDDTEGDASLCQFNKRKNARILFLGCVKSYLVLLKVRDMRTEGKGCDNISFDKLLNQIDSFYELAMSHLADIEKDGLSELEIDGSEIKADISIKEVWSMAAELLSNPPESGKGVMAQVRLYDSLRNARACGKKFRHDEVVKLLMSESETKDYRPLGDSQWARHRQKIVCTDKKSSISTWKDGLQIPGVMVMDEQDINDYNNSVPPDRQLKFEINHPQNGVVYVQHPMQQDVYIDIDSFHSSLLERKYNELIKLLEALGAISINCEVENNASADEKRARKVKAGAHADVPSAGEGSVEGEYRGASSKMSALHKKLQKHIENRKTNESPHLPEGLLFYWHEDDWKNLADNVMKGRRIEEETTLTYREDFAVTGQNLFKLEVKLKSVIPGYEFSADANFSHEFEEELKQLKSTIWHYHVKFGAAQAEDESRISRPIEKLHDAGGVSDKERAESILRKACKNCARSEYGRQNGCINAEQRATLEALAKKYGVDELRLEELSAEAFDTAGGIA